MRGLYEEDDGHNFFESFSDVALCTLTVTLVLAALLAMSVRQSINVELNERQFNHDALPNRMYLSCSVQPGGSSSMIHFLDANRFDTLLAMDSEREVGRRVRLDASYSLKRSHFALLAPALFAGCDEEGNSALSLLPREWSPEVQVGSQLYRFDDDVAAEMLASISVVSREAGASNRGRVYVESLQNERGERFVIMGHAVYRLPEAVEDGSLAWLSGFMSGTSDLIYLGDAGGRVGNRRVRVMRLLGFEAAAAAYESFLRNTSMDVGEETPLQQYTEAWRAYIDWCVEQDEDPPSWFFSDFLVKMGFDRMVMQRPME